MRIAILAGAAVLAAAGQQSLDHFPSGRLAPAGSAAFQMDLPPGWHARLGQSGAVVAASQDNSAVVIAPVWGGGEGAAGYWLRQNAAAALRPYFNGPVITGIYPSRTGTNAALAAVDFGGGEGTANVLYLVNGGVGTLYVIAAPKAVFFEQRPRLVRILRSFSFTGERAGGGAAAQAAPRTSFTRFQDPNEGAFTVDVPAGWKVEGGLVRKSTLDTRPFVWATAPDDSTLIRLRDPSLGTFVTPSQSLAFAGLQEGMPYSPGYGNVWLISRYLPGPQFAQQYAAKLAGETQTSGLQLTAANPRQDLTRSKVTGIIREETTGGEATFTCVRNGRPCAGKVVAATTIVLTSASPEGSVWNIEYLASYLTPQDQADATDRVFQHMLASLQYNPQWVAMQNQTAYNTGQIARDAAQHTARIIDEVYQNRQAAEERISQSRTDVIRGRVRLKDPQSGEEMEGVAGRNYYYRAPGGRAIGADTVIHDPDFTELEQIR